MKYLIIIFISILFYTPIANAQAATTGTNNDYYATNANDVTDGLVLWWPGRHQGMSYAQDVSQYKVRGTITGASWGTGTGRGLYFDGVDDYVSFGDPSDGHLDFGTSSFSVFLNVCLRVVSAYSHFISKTNYNGSIGWWFRNESTTSFRCATMHNGTTTAVLSSSIFGTGTSVNIGMVLDASAFPNVTLKQYVNGNQTGTATKNIGTGTVSNSDDLLLSNIFSTLFDGNLWDVRIYNRALSGDEVNRIYTATKQ